MSAARLRHCSTAMDGVASRRTSSFSKACSCSPGMVFLASHSREDIRGNMTAVVRMLKVEWVTAMPKEVMAESKN